MRSPLFVFALGVLVGLQPVARKRGPPIALAARDEDGVAPFHQFTGVRPSPHQTRPKETRTWRGRETRIASRVETENSHLDGNQLSGLGLSVAVDHFGHLS